jgi:colanic acid biosynthesis glycosyl transferase WcaI
VYNVQDVYPDVVIRLGILKRPIAIAASRFLELFIYRRAAGITVLTEGFRRNLIAKGVPPEKIAVIPNFADPGFIRPLPASASLRTRWGLDGKFVAMHAGNLGHSQNVETLLEAAAILTSDPEIELVIVGNGSRRDELEQHARRRQLANVRFVPFVPRADVPALYATADVGLVALKAGVAAESVPSKVYSIMASARPVVAALDRDSDSWKFIVDRQCGVCVEPADARGLAEAIRRFKSEPRQRVDAGMNGRRTVLESFTPREIALQYHALLLALDSSADVASVVRQQAAG